MQPLSSLETVLNCEVFLNNNNEFDLSDIQWLQASPRYQSRMVAWEWDVCLRLQFPPFWHQLQAHSPSRRTFSQVPDSQCASSDDSYFQAYLTLWFTTFGDIPDILPRKQPFWDRPGIQADRFRVECSLSSPFQRAAFLAASPQYSGDWLHALPIAWCGNNTDRQRTDSIGEPFYKRSPKMLQDVTLCVTASNLRVLSSFPWRPLFFLPVVICQSWPASASACLPFDVDSKPSQASPSHDVFLSFLSCLQSNLIFYAVVLFFFFQLT